MTVELDLNMLQEVGMSPDDFVYLYLIHRNGYEYIPQLNIKPNLDKLQENGYVKLADAPENHVVRHKFLDLFLADFDVDDVRSSPIVSQLCILLQVKSVSCLAQSKDN